MCPEWVKNTPSYNITICTRLCGVIFEDYYITPRQDMYKIICELDENDKE